MADPVIGTPATRVEDGRRYTTIEIVQDETTLVASEFSIPIPDICTSTLITQSLGGTGNAADTRPVAGVKSSFVVEEDGFVVQALAAAAFHRIAEDKRMVGRPEGGEGFGRLYIRSTPDVNLSGDQTITTRVTVVWGHR